jgi:hypothetical protein
MTPPLRCFGCTISDHGLWLSFARLAARSSLPVDMQAGTRTGAHWQRRHDYLIYMNDVYEQATLVAGLLLSRER